MAFRPPKTVLSAGVLGTYGPLSKDEVMSVVKLTEVPVPVRTGAEGTPVLPDHPTFERLLDDVIVLEDVTTH